MQKESIKTPFVLHGLIALALVGLFVAGLAWGARAAIVDVTITADGTLSPPTVSIAVGDQIRWTNTSDFEEQPASDDHNPVFGADHNRYTDLNVGSIAPGGIKTSPALTRIGTWGYHNHSCGVSCPGTIVIAGKPGQLSGACTDCTPPGVRFFRLASTSAASATIFWETDEPSITRIEFGTSTDYAMAAERNGGFRTEHAVYLENLLPATAYHFRIAVRDKLGNKDVTRYPNQTFKTLPLPPSPAPVPPPPAPNEPQERISMLEAEITGLRTKAVAALAESGFRFTRPLRRGSSGEEVRHLQFLLVLDPVLYPEGLVTGYFGPATEAAVKRFQRKLGIITREAEPGFGRVGPKTREKLNELLSNDMSQKKMPSAPSRALAAFATAAILSAGQTVAAPPAAGRDAFLAKLGEIEHQIGELQKKIDALVERLAADRRAESSGRAREPAPAGGSGAIPVPPGSRIIDVTITEEEFLPKLVVIQKGDRIRWRNQSPFAEYPDPRVHGREPTKQALEKYPPLGAEAGEIPAGGTRTTAPLTPVGWWGYHNHNAGGFWHGLIVIQDSSSRQPSIGSLRRLLPTAVLRPGMRGPEVANLQSLLRYNPVLYPEGLVTGHFGEATEQAIIRFQQRYGIFSFDTMDDRSRWGVVGQETRQQLAELFGMNR